MVTKALDIFPTSLGLLGGALPTFEAREEAWYQGSELWEWGQAGLQWW